MALRNTPIPVYRLGTDVPYTQAAQRQEAQVDRREEALFLCEHPPTVTLGSASKPEDLTLPYSYYERMGCAVYESPRGGQATYHGPGQLVVYPILNLRARGMTVHGHIRFLEDFMMHACAAYGISTRRIEGKSGLWVHPSSKIGFTGIRVRKGFAYHGASLNVLPQAQAFRAIVPCGMPDLRIISIYEESPQPPALWDVADVIETYVFKRLDPAKVQPQMA